MATLNNKKIISADFEQKKCFFPYQKKFSKCQITISKINNRKIIYSTTTANERYEIVFNSKSHLPYSIQYIMNECSEAFSFRQTKNIFKPNSNDICSP